MFLDEGANAVAEELDEPCDKEETQAPTEDGSDDEEREAIVHHAGEDGEDLIGYRRDGSYEDSQKAVSGIPNLNLLAGMPTGIE